VAVAVGRVSLRAYRAFTVWKTDVNTISTNETLDVNGREFVAPRAGPGERVLVMKTSRVKKGQYWFTRQGTLQVQVAIKQAAVVTAGRRSGVRRAQAHALVALGPGHRFQLEPAIEDASHTGREDCEPMWRLQQQEGKPSNWGGPIQNGARSCYQRGHQQADIDIRRQTVKR